jgi:hypothetical protein
MRRLTGAVVLLTGDVDAAKPRRQRALDGQALAVYPIDHVPGQPTGRVDGDDGNVQAQIGGNKSVLQNLSEAPRVTADGRHLPCPDG